MIACNLDFLNWVILLVLVDVINDLCIYMDMCPKKEKSEWCVRKNEKDDGEEQT